MQREYGLDLARDLERLTWRRFLVLVRGLSPNSATVARLTASRTVGAKRPERLSRSPEESERVFDSFFGPPRAKAAH